MEDQLFESIRNKNYFNKANEWYSYRYLFCIIERSWLMLIVSFLLVYICLLLLNIYLLFPIKKNLNFVRYMNHADDEFSAMHELSLSKKDNEYISIARYLIKKYVEIYESYKAEEPSFQESFIKNNSIRKVYKNFQEKINSEVSAYKRKVIDTDMVKLSIDQSIMNLATFTGSATVVFTIEQNKKIHDQIVEISFTLSNIQETLNGITPFKFMVKDYKTSIPE